MKWIYSILVIGVLNCFANNAMPHKSAELIAPRNIQVLIVKDASEALLEVKGPYHLINPHDGSKITSGLLGKRFMVRSLDAGIKWGEEFPGIHQFYIRPRSQETSIFVNGIQYNGAIAVFGIAGQIHIINDLDIETYVKAELTSHFPSPLEQEVLASLAIVLRTEAYYHSTKNEDSFWHVTAEDTKFQGSALIVPGSPVERAVDSTRHLILVHPENGRNAPFAASWTEHSAGKTASYETMFRKNALCPEKGVDAPHAALARTESKWNYKIAKQNLAHLLEIPQIRSIETFIDPTSNKVYGVRIKDEHHSHDIDFFTLQAKLGTKHLLSSDFSVTMKDDTIVFSGFGKGHGVGLCLYSASALAQNGENAVKILSKFFPETYLYNINAIPGE